MISMWKDSYTLERESSPLPPQDGGGKGGVLEGWVDFGVLVYMKTLQLLTLGQELTDNVLSD